ncbi:putative transcription repressor NiaR [Actinomyces israelii]|nr:putative transcription repressor NiaR [Actinomyces israelii]
MDAADRRNAILRRLEGTTTPLPAARLGEDLGVSRQIIVGDVALLRASGHSIHATNRGYLLARPATRPRRSLMVQHTREQIPAELSAILDAGGTIIDISIEHRLYGQITADLLIRNRRDLKAFLARLTTSSSLAELTNGWHTHTIEADSEKRLDAIARRLDALGLLRPEDAG